MKILILAAMDKELNLLLDLIKEPEDKSFNNIRIWTGQIQNHTIFLSKCGIGKVNSALNTYRLIMNLKPDLVVNSGVAGGAGIPIGTVLLADKIAYHDVWCGPGTVYGQADGYPLFMLPDSKILNLGFKSKIEKGLICSGDKFISTPQEISFIREKFPEVRAVDMESASIAQTCLMCGTPFAILRVVSDTPGEGENISQYKDFWNKAPEKTFEVLSDLISQL